MFQQKTNLKKIGILCLFVFVFIPSFVFSQGPPSWAPAHGYRAKTRHIYFPEYNLYYDIQKKNYIYLNNGKWTFGTKIPTTITNIRLSKSTQIELDFYGDSPQHYNNSHKTKYKPQFKTVKKSNNPYKKVNHKERK